MAEYRKDGPVTVNLLEGKDQRQEKMHHSFSASHGQDYMSSPPPYMGGRGGMDRGMMRPMRPYSRPQNRGRPRYPSRGFRPPFPGAEMYPPQGMMMARPNGPPGYPMNMAQIMQMQMQMPTQMPMSMPMQVPMPYLVGAPQGRMPYQYQGPPPPSMMVQAMPQAPSSAPGGELEGDKASFGEPLYQKIEQMEGVG